MLTTLATTPLLQMTMVRLPVRTSTIVEQSSNLTPMYLSNNSIRLIQKGMVVASKAITKTVQAHTTMSCQATHRLVIRVLSLPPSLCHKAIRTAAPTCKGLMAHKECKHLVEGLVRVLIKALIRACLVGLTGLSPTLV